MDCGGALSCFPLLVKDHSLKGRLKKTGKKANTEKREEDRCRPPSTQYRGGASEKDAFFGDLSTLVKIEKRDHTQGERGQVTSLTEITPIGQPVMDGWREQSNHT